MHLFLRNLLKTILLWGLALIGFWLASFLINDEIDRKILLDLNPDSYIPVIDELMVAITDFSMAIFGVIFAFWEIGYLIKKHKKVDVSEISKWMRIMGFLLGIGIMTGFWWAGYKYKHIFFLLALIIVVGFWWISNSYSSLDENYQEMLHKVVLLTILAALMSLGGEYVTKFLVHRPRPLNNENSDWNFAIVVRPDENVSGSFSYYSGHSSGLFAALTPLMWKSKKPTNKILLFFWASIHAYSRIYLAAHFPFCALMGSLAGFLWGTIVIKVFKN